MAEFLGTFGLVLGVHGLAVNKKAPQGWAGLIIGLNIAGLIVLLGNVSGAAMNPGRTFDPIFADWVLGGPNLWSELWVYWLAQALAAIAVTAVYPVISMAALPKQSKKSSIQDLAEFNFPQCFTQEFCKMLRRHTYLKRQSRAVLGCLCLIK